MSSIIWKNLAADGANNNHTNKKGPTSVGRHQCARVSCVLASKGEQLDDVNKRSEGFTLRPIARPNTLTHPFA